MTARRSPGRDKPSVGLAAGLGALEGRRRSDMRKLRCAVYTRKSSEEGLDMDFNSLARISNRSRFGRTRRRPENRYPNPTPLAPVY